MYVPRHSKWRNGKIRGKGRSSPPLPLTLPHNFTATSHSTYLKESALKAPQWQQVTKKTQVHHFEYHIGWGTHPELPSTYHHTENCRFQEGEELRGRIKFINILFPYFGVTQRPDYPRLCGPLLSASTFANHSNSAPKSLLCAILAIKRKYFSLVPLSLYCFHLLSTVYFSFSRKSSGIWFKA